MYLGLENSEPVESRRYILRIAKIKGRALDFLEDQSSKLELILLNSGLEMTANLNILCCHFVVSPPIKRIFLLFQCSYTRSGQNNSN